MVIFALASIIYRVTSNSTNRVKRSPPPIVTDVLQKSVVYTTHFLYRLTQIVEFVTREIWQPLLRSINRHTESLKKKLVRKRTKPFVPL